MPEVATEAREASRLSRAGQAGSIACRVLREQFRVLFQEREEVTAEWCHLTLKASPWWLHRDRLQEGKSRSKGTLEEVTAGAQVVLNCTVPKPAGLVTFVTSCCPL